MVCRLAKVASRRGNNGCRGGDRVMFTDHEQCFRIDFLLRWPIFTEVKRRCEHDKPFHLCRALNGETGAHEPAKARADENQVLHI